MHFRMLVTYGAALSFLIGSVVDEQGTAYAQPGSITYPDAEKDGNSGEEKSKGTSDEDGEENEAKEDKKGGDDDSGGGGDSGGKGGALDDLKGGKLIRYGVTAGVGGAIHWANDGAIQKTFSESTMPYVAIFPMKWAIRGDVTRAYCAASWAGLSARSEANSAAVRLALERLEGNTRVARMIARVTKEDWVRHVKDNSDYATCRAEEERTGSTLVTCAEGLLGPSKTKLIQAGRLVEATKDCITAAKEAKGAKDEEDEEDEEDAKDERNSACSNDIAALQLELDQRQEALETAKDHVSFVEASVVHAHVYALTAWDVLLDGSCYPGGFPTWIGLYFGVPGKFTANARLDAGVPIQSREFQPRYSVGLALSPVSAITIMLGLTFSHVEDEDKVLHDVMSWTVSLGANLDLIGFFFP